MKKPALNTLTPEQYEKRLNKILLAKLGQAWMFWPPRAEVKRRCAVPGESGWWTCQTCHTKVEVLDVDHIEPCVPTDEAHRNWHEYITRRFVFDSTKLQGLCKRCHKVKTKEENKLRRCKHKRTWFDRTLSAQDLSMHTRCSDCGKTLD